MESKNKLKEIDIKNHTCYCFDDIIKDININFSDILLDEKLYEIFQFMALHTKLKWVQNNCVLDSMK